jgi:hypothetical protein
VTRRLHSVTAPVAEDLAAQDESLAVQCPLCQAPRDAYCTNPLTGRHLHNRISHWQRLAAAQAARTEDQ